MSKYDKVHYDLSLFSGRVGMLVLRLTHGNQSEFARQIGLSRQHVHQWMKLDQPTTGAVGRVLARYPEIDAEWLMSGRGDMLIPGASMTSAGPSSIEQPEVFRIPLVSPGRSAGAVELMTTGASRFVDRVRFTERFGGPPEEYADYAVVGDAMEPTIRAGDTVMLRRFQSGQTILDGAIYLLSAKTGEKISTTGLRRIRFHSGRVHLEPDNPAYEKSTTELTRFEQLVTLHGVVKWSDRMH